MVRWVALATSKEIDNCRFQCSPVPSCCCGRLTCCPLQGFVEFRIGAQPLHLDVDTLNERLKVQGANRMRHAMRPDEAYGMIFSLDNVIVNTKQLQQKAWQKIAQEEGLELPSMERQIYDVRPERAITEVCTRRAESTHSYSI